MSIVIFCMTLVGLITTTKTVYNLFSTEKLSITDRFEKVEIYISEGETAWTIQSRLMGEVTGFDIRDLLEDVKQINNRDNLNLVQGETVVFFKAKEI